MTATGSQHDHLSALDVLELARRAWERSQPQLFIELPDAVTTAAPERLPYTRPASRRPAVPINSNGTRRTTIPGSAAGASQERF